MKKERMGDNPLSWIPQKENENVEELPSNLNNLSQQNNSSNMNNLSKLEKSHKLKEASDGWTRATFLIKEEHLEKIKDFAYWERLQIKEALDTILTEHFANKTLERRPSRG